MKLNGKHYLCSMNYGVVFTVYDNMGWNSGKN